MTAIMRSLVFLILVMLCLALEAPLRSDAALSTFLIGGHVPNWLIEYDTSINAPLTPEQSKALPAYQSAVQQKAGELFDFVIPGAITWKNSEPRRGETDFRIYDIPAAWAKQHHKPSIVQHLFWEDPRTFPEWAQSIEPGDLKKAVITRIVYTKAHLGDVFGLTVVNEMLYFHYLRDRFGDGIVKDIFDRTKKVFPRTVLYLDENPWQQNIDPRDPDPVMTGMGRLAKLVNALKSQHVLFDKVGIQLYTSKADIEKLGGIDAALRRLNGGFDYFKEATGFNLTVLEFGFTSPDEAYKAEFVKKILTMCKDHPAVEGFFFYHWLDEQAPGNALVHKDGALTPAGEAVADFRRMKR